MPIGTVAVKEAKPGAVGLMRAVSNTAPFTVGFQPHVAVNGEMLPVVGIEMQPAIRFPFARNVTAEAALTLKFIVVELR